MRSRQESNNKNTGREDSRSKKFTASKGKSNRLDEDIEKLLISTTDIRRKISHELRRISKKYDLSERSLYIITMVNAGLNRPSMLIKYFEVLPSTITGETDRLVASGLMMRHAHPTDRRVNLLALTDRGQAVREEALGALNGAFRSRLDNMDPASVQISIETLRQLVDASIPETPLPASNAPEPHGASQTKPSSKSQLSKE